MSLWAALHYSANSLARSPGLALALLLTIALGIGSNASVQGFVRGLVIRDVPLASNETLVSVFARDAQNTFGPMSYDEYISLKDQSQVFEVVGAARESKNSLVMQQRSQIMSVSAISPELAGLLRLSTDNGVVISHRVWRAEFRSKANLDGETIRVDGIDREVKAVAPEWLEGLYVDRAVDVWVPLQETALGEFDSRSRTFWVLGRLRPNISTDAAEDSLNADRGDAIAVLPYSGMTPEVAGGMYRVGKLLGVAGVAVLLIACANIALFLLARASSRTEETAVRVALGATRHQLRKQLLADSVLISVFGAAAGMLLATWTAQIMPALFFERDAAQLVFAPNVFGIVTASAACAGITILCGLIPLFEMRHDQPAVILQRQSVRRTTAPRRLRGALLVAQMACCCVLVISTGVLFDGFRTALRTSVAHRLGSPILATLESFAGFRRPDLGQQYFREAADAVRSLPGVSTLAWVSTLPGTPPSWRAMRIEPPTSTYRDVVMHVAAFTPQSLNDITLPPLAGRMFGIVDTAQSCRVVVINEVAAMELFEGNAVGRSIEDPVGQRVEIIGVVATRSIRDETPRPIIYYYAQQTGFPADRDGPARFRVFERPPPASAIIAANVVSNAYFDAIGLVPIAGTVFPESAAPLSCRVGVINEEAAELYFGGDAVGGALIDSIGQRTEIVAVVHSSLLRSSQRRTDPTVYLPVHQNYLPRMTLVVGAAVADDALLEGVRRRLGNVSPDTGTVTVTTLDAHLSKNALASERIATVLVAAFTATALVLGALGVYGTMAESARQRQREIALRIALGAAPRHVIRQVVAEGVRLAGVGTIAGMLGSLVVSSWLSSITPSALSRPAWVWAGAPLVLLGVVALASVFPTRRALSVDPLTIMRD